jgi:glutamate racemase
MSASEAPIGIFDSGLGGLTVVRALHERLPNERLVYFGDTARVPYGIKSPETVTRFAAEDCQFLLRFEPKLIVVACNTASASALPALKDWLHIPVVGVVHPGAQAAVAKANGRPVLVLGTEGTVRSQAYEFAIHHLDARISVVQKACPLLVPCVEEGRTSQDSIVRMALEEYLRPVLAQEPNFGVVVMGCTHYPLIREAIQETCGPKVELVCSAQQTAEAVVQELDKHELHASHHGSDPAHYLTCWVSDNQERFARVGGRFLGEPIRQVEWIGPEDFAGHTDPLCLRGADAS